MFPSGILSGCFSDGQEPAEKETPAYVTAYRKVIEDFASSDKNQYEDAAFTLAYLDDDDIPELLIADTYAKVGQVYIYTYNVSEAILVDITGANGLIYYTERSGMFVTVDEDMLCSSITVSKINATVTEQVWTGRTEYDADGSSDEAEYYSDGKKISKKKYDELVEKYKPEDILSNADGYSLTEENIKSIIK